MITVGLPGSGKSTWLARQGANAISSDEIRRLLADDPTDQTIHARVFAAIRYLLRHRLAIGRPVTYIDATLLTPEERRPFVEIARWYECDLEAVYFDIPLEVCRERNRARDRIVPREAMEMMALKTVPPLLDEGFTKITVVNH